MSEKMSLSRIDLNKIVRQSMIFYSPIILLFLNQIEAWEIDLKIIYAMFLSITVETLRRFLTDYTKNEININWKC